VRFVPTSFINIIEEDFLEHHDITWSYQQQQYINFKTRQEFAKTTKQGRLRIFSIEAQNNPKVAVATIKISFSAELNTLHRCYGHLHIEKSKLLLIQNNMKVLN
jgi:hypothetical protein